MLQSIPMGLGSGSGGELETGHVICPACAHNFKAIPQNAQERIAELEAALADLIELADESMRAANNDGGEYDRDAALAGARALLQNK